MTLGGGGGGSCGFCFSWWCGSMLMDKNFFSVFNFHFPLGNNVCGQKRSSQYCCGYVCLAKTHYTGYYCGRSPGGPDLSDENIDDPGAKNIWSQKYIKVSEEEFVFVNEETSRRGNVFSVGTKWITRFRLNTQTWPQDHSRQPAC